MSPRVVKWFSTYLDRTQILRYGDSISNKKNIPTAIAQGMVLGPLIFISFTVKTR